MLNHGMILHIKDESILQLAHKHKLNKIIKLFSKYDDTTATTIPNGETVL